MPEPNAINWLNGGFGLTVVGIVGAFVRSKLTAAASEKTANERERAQLIASINMLNSQTLAIVQNELKVQHDITSRFFELHDRNTKALEQLVAEQVRRGQEMHEMRGQISEIKGMVAQLRTVSS